MKRWAALAVTAALMVLIFALSAQPGPSSSQLSNAVARAVRDSGAQSLVPNWFGGNLNSNLRKWAHVFLYAALGTSAMVTVRLWRPQAGRLRQALKAAGLCLLYAASDEIHQYFVPHRAMLWGDIGVDALGFVPGILLVCLLVWRRRRRKK